MDGTRVETIIGNNSGMEGPVDVAYRVGRALGLGEGETAKVGDALLPLYSEAPQVWPTAADVARALTRTLGVPLREVTVWVSPARWRTRELWEQGSAPRAC